jgi:hypothetical protein
VPIPFLPMSHSPPFNSGLWNLRELICPEDPHKAQSFATTNSSFPVTTLASIQRLLSSAAWGRIPWIYLAGNQSWVLLLLPLFTSSLHHFLPLTWMDLLSKASFQSPGIFPSTKPPSLWPSQACWDA